MKKLIEATRHLPIRVRVTAATLMIFLVFVWLVVSISSKILYARMTESLGLQQQAVASLMASHVGEHIQTRIGALERLAAKAEANRQTSSAGFQVLLDAFGADSDLFNGGVFVVDSDGELLASIPEGVNRRGLKYDDRDYFRTVMQTGRPVIGEPVLGRALQSPLVVLAVPVKAPGGAVTSVLAGAIDLGGPNFFDRIIDSKYAGSGYFLLIDRTNRMIVTSTDRKRIMEYLDPDTSSQVVVAHLSGDNISSIGRNPHGVEVLTSAQSIPGSNWYVAVSLPTSVAFAPVKQAENTILKMTIILGLATALLTWMGIRHELRPLYVTQKQVDALMLPSANLVPLPVERSNEIGHLVTGFNYLIKEVAKREEKLKESEFRWMFAIDGSGNGLWDWNMQNDTVYYSRQWKAMLGFAEHEIGDSLNEWKHRVHPDDLEMTLAAVKKHVEGEADVFEYEHRILCKNGEYLWILNRGVIVSRDAQQRPLRMIGTHTDISKRKVMEAQIRQFAFNDPLTGLPNRRLFHDRFEQAMRTNKRSGDFCGLMLIDLDNFKSLNDQHGHAAGDLLLIEVASRMRKAVRETDTVARIGGDEFAVLLARLGGSHESASLHALQVAEKMRLSLAVPYLIQPEGYTSTVQHVCTTSIGLVVFSAGVASQGDLMRQADARMYAAKMMGRNRVVDVDVDVDVVADV